MGKHTAFRRFSAPTATQANTTFEQQTLREQCDNLRTVALGALGMAGASLQWVLETVARLERGESRSADEWRAFRAECEAALTASAHSRATIQAMKVMNRDEQRLHLDAVLQQRDAIAALAGSMLTVAHSALEQLHNLAQQIERGEQPPAADVRAFIQDYEAGRAAIERARAELRAAVS